MFGVLRTLAGDVIDGPAFLYDGDFWLAVIAIAFAAVITVGIVLLCVKSAKRRAMRKKIDEEMKNLSGEE